MQLKCSAKPSGGSTEAVSLKVSTYNLIWSKLQVAMLVKYIASENEGYWLLFHDVPAPDQRLKSFTIHIPRENRLSTNQWGEVQAHVRTVTDRKLAAQRASELESKRQRASEAPGV